MKAFFCVDERNQACRAVLYWEGPGWYAAGQRWDDSRLEWFVLIEKVGSDREDFETAKKRARELLLGCPIWAEFPNEAASPYRILHHPELRIVRARNESTGQGLLVYWAGAGWYARAHRFDPIRNEHYSLIQQVSRDPYGFTRASRVASEALLGVPFWVDRLEELLEGYQIES